jgi:toxin FitB
VIVLDTNVISEPLRPSPNANVLAWLDQQDANTLYLTTITVAELRYGVAALPDSRRRKHLEGALEDRIVPLFENRVLAFDDAATKAYAQVRVRARAAGKAISTADSYIAAISHSLGFAIATRDGTPFEAAGLKVIDPWMGPAE